jgi:hypothetical protein
MGRSREPIALAVIRQGHFLADKAQSSQIASWIGLTGSPTLPLISLDGA